MIIFNNAIVRKYSNYIWFLFILFFISNTIFLSTVPSLIGDEGSEGENVFQILASDTVTLRGERSYIGPLIDYLRIPFILLLGYHALPLRLFTLFFSCACFFLSLYVLSNLYNDKVALIASTGMLFSPPYLLYQRLSWTITLIPFFALLYLAFTFSNFKWKWFWAGLAGGLGIHSHILFLPLFLPLLLITFISKLTKITKLKHHFGYVSLSLLLLIAGIAVGINTQWFSLFNDTSDQGDSPEKAAFFQRVDALPDLLPQVISGSSYVARYTGTEFSTSRIKLITTGIVILSIVGSVQQRRNARHWSVLITIVIYLFLLTYIIERFTLRYYLPFTLMIWVTAGVGLAAVLHTCLKNTRKTSLTAIIVSLLFMSWTLSSTLLPYLITGGATNEFSIGNRVDRAAAFVNTKPLISCLEKIGPVYTDNIHIYNRILYLSHSNPTLHITTDDKYDDAIVKVDYKFANSDCRFNNSHCPDLIHFCLSPIQQIN